jgi:hypothetical protein
LGGLETPELTTLMNNSRSTDVVKSISVRGIGFAGLFLSCLTGCPGSLDPAFLQPGGIAPGGTGGAGGDVVLMDCPDAPAKLATGCSGASCHISTFGRNARFSTDKYRSKGIAGV